MSQPFPSPTIPTPKIPPEVATIGAFAFGVLMTLLTATGVTPANANAIVAALQFVLYAVFAVAGAWGQIHVHTQHLKAQVQLATFTGTPLQTAVLNAPDAQLGVLPPIPPPPASDAPAAPSYVPPGVPSAGTLTVSTSTVTAHAPTQIVPPDAPQPPAADTPVQVVPVVAAAPPASAQVATDAT